VKKVRGGGRPGRQADPSALRVTHCPVNIAGVPWANVQALRRKGVDARLVVFERGRLHPDADWSLDRSGGLARRQLTQWRAFARLLPRTDVFHFYFGLTLVPKSLQFPLLRLTGRRSVFHFLGSDIRGKSPQELGYGRRAGAQIVGSYDAIRWVPDAEVVPPGLDLTAYRPTARARSSSTPPPAARARGRSTSSRLAATSPSTWTSSRACPTRRPAAVTNARTSSSTS